jgi:hypothetical protein
MDTTNSAHTNCESCGMPLASETKSMRDPKYCIYCQNQDTGDLASYDHVRTGSVNAAIRIFGKTQEEAEKMADTMLPTLPRWKKT